MRKFILGTDWWTDCDDAAAVKILADAAVRGEIELLGAGINACMEYSVSSLVNFLRMNGLNGVPVGIDKAATDFGGTPRYQKRLAEYSDNLPGNDSAPDAADLYIKLIGDSTEPVEIIEIGFPQVLANAMKKAPEIFEKKVTKIWMMAGKWDEENGLEHNFANAKRASTAANYVCGHCPVPITFLGFEVGESVIVGGKLDRETPLYGVFADHGSENGRCAWDPMLALTAIIGDEEKAGYKLIKGTASVNAETGENNFTPDVNGKHGYVVKAFPDSYYADMIDSLL